MNDIKTIYNNLHEVKCKDCGCDGGSSTADIELDVNGWSNYYSAWGDVLKSGAGTRLHFQYVDPYYPTSTMNLSCIVTDIAYSGYGNQYSVEFGKNNSGLAYPTPETYYNYQKVLDEMMENGLATDLEGKKRNCPYYDAYNIQQSAEVEGNVTDYGRVYVLASNIDIYGDPDIDYRWIVPVVTINGQEYVCEPKGVGGQYYYEVTEVAYHLKSDFTPTPENVYYYPVSKETVEGFIGCWFGSLGD